MMKLSHKFASAVLGLLLLAAPAFPNEALEKEMLDLVNAERVKVGLSPYKFAPELTPIARSHSADMIKNKFFDHKSPTTGFVQDRAFAAKLRAVGYGENIAMNQTIKAAHTALMNSPGHKANILHKDFTHCGIGVIKTTGGNLFVTQVFSIPAPPVDVKTLPVNLIASINKKRDANGLKPLSVNEAMAKIATEQAVLMAKTGVEQKNDFPQAVRDAGIKYSKLIHAHMMTWSPEDLADLDVFNLPISARVGFGFAENTEHKNLGYGMIWAVIVIAVD